MKKIYEKLELIKEFKYYTPEDDFEMFEEVILLTSDILEELNLPETSYNQEMVTKIAFNEKELQDLLDDHDSFPLDNTPDGLEKAIQKIFDKRGRYCWYEIAALKNIFQHVYNQPIVTDWMEQKISYDEMMERISNDYDFLNTHG